MEELKAYLRSLEGEDAKLAFAKRCGTSLNYLKSVAYNAKKASESLAINIERESSGAVKVEMLRPDVDWAVIRNPRPAEPTDESKAA